MTNYLDVGTVIFSSLKDTIKTYPLVADNDAKYPFAVYKRNSLMTGYSKDGLHQLKTTIEVSVVAEKYSQSIQKADAIIDKLKGIEFEGLYQEVRLTNAIEYFDGQAFVQTLSFEITINL